MSHNPTFRRTHLPVPNPWNALSDWQARLCDNGTSAIATPNYKLLALALVAWADSTFDGLIERIERLEKRTAVKVAVSLERRTPTPKKKVGTPYIADKLGCTKVYVAQMAREGKIPRNCIVPGTGDGKPWKFYRKGIDKWIESR